MTTTPSPDYYWQQALGTLSKETQEDILESINDPQVNTDPRADMVKRVEKLLDLLQNQLALCRSEKWKVPCCGSTIHLREEVSKVVDCLGVYHPSCDVAVNYRANVLALPWAAIRLVHLATQADITEHRCLEKMVEKLALYTDSAQSIENMHIRNAIPGPADQLLVKHLSSLLIALYATILESTSFCHSQFKKSTLQRAFQAILGTKEGQARLSKLDKAKLVLETQVNNIRGSQFDHTRADDLTARTDITSREAMEIRNSISAIQFASDHELVRSERTPDTGNWILDHENFLSWEASSDSAIVLLYGDPGAGKTHLASRVIDHLRHDLEKRPSGTAALAYFYCNRSEKTRRQPEFILRSLIRQLASSPDEPDELVADIQNLPERLSRRGSSLDVLECQDEMARVVRAYSRTMLVLDALDECDQDKRAQLMTYLTTLSEQSSQESRSLKVFISSRKAVDIERHFELCEVIEICAEYTQPDIKKFVKERLSRDNRWRDLGRQRQDASVDALLRMSNGVFLRAALQIQQLVSLPDSWEGLTISSRLNEQPRSLQATYDQIWKDIQSKDKDKDKRKWARRAIRWVLCSQQRLSTKQLSEATKFNNSFGSSESASILRLLQSSQSSPSSPLSPFSASSGYHRIQNKSPLTKEYLYEACGSFLVPRRNRWEFIHSSAAEYVEESLSSQLQPHCHLGIVCVDRLLKVLGDDDELDRSDWLWRYASCSWAYHVRMARNEPPGRLYKVLSDLTNAFVGTSQRSSTVYEKWLRQFNDRTLPTSSMGQDAGFFLMLRDPSVGRDPWLYSSAIYGVCGLGLTVVLEHWYDDDPSMDLNSCNNAGFSPLSLAVKFGHSDTCRFLLSRGAEPEGGNPSPLVTACQNDNSDIVSLLTRAKADVNKASTWKEGTRYHSESPLQAAIRSHKPGGTVVQLLIDKGADPNMGGEGQAPLDLAIHKRDQQLISLLQRECARGRDEEVAV